MKRLWREWALCASVLLLLFAVLGFVVAASGIIPLKASSGHWAITEWVLQFGKRRSLDTHTLGMELPPLNEAWMIAKGAGHYESGCRPCHGSPDLKNPRIAAAMLPPPPDLQEIVGKLNPQELFYVVKHGIKFTGMPAWPSPRRDDEVHAIVAFLLELPKLDATSYRRMVDGPSGRGPGTPLRDLIDPPVPLAVTSSCARCHGMDGRGRGVGAFPKLAGQNREYLIGALRAYSENQRSSGIMGPVAAGLKVDEWRALANYYGGLPAGSPAQQRTTADANAMVPSAARGQAIATHGIPDQGVPSCRDCHGPTAHRRNPAYPELATQYASYIVLQLELFKEERRGGSPYAHLMRHVASRLTHEQMRDVASYYETLPPASDVTQDE